MHRKAESRPFSIPSIVDYTTTGYSTPFPHPHGVRLGTPHPSVKIDWELKGHQKLYLRRKEVVGGIEKDMK